jgi:regulatory protein YycI of two-component signal transduction system YycFG
MDNTKLYKNIGLVIWIIVTLFLGYQFFHKKESTIDNSVANARIDSLQKEKQIILNDSRRKDSLNAIDKQVIVSIRKTTDSLLTVISKTPSKYNGAYTKAKNASANTLVREFTTIFSDNNVR